MQSDRRIATIEKPWNSKNQYFNNNKKKNQQAFDAKHEIQQTTVGKETPAISQQLYKF